MRTDEQRGEQAVWMWEGGSGADRRPLKGATFAQHCEVPQGNSP
jgi:hypothetical protein